MRRPAQSEPLPCRLDTAGPREAHSQVQACSSRLGGWRRRHPRLPGPPALPRQAGDQWLTASGPNRAVLAFVALLVQVNKDALLAFCESGKIFIHFLTATANDVCKEAKRQTISADDVITALEDLELGDLVVPLREALEGGAGRAAGRAGRAGLWGGYGAAVRPAPAC